MLHANRYSPSSCGISWQNTAMAVVKPVDNEAANAAPTASPSLKLWKPSLTITIHATLAIDVVTSIFLLPWWLWPLCFCDRIPSVLLKSVESSRMWLSLRVLILPLQFWLLLASWLRFNSMQFASSFSQFNATRDPHFWFPAVDSDSMLFTLRMFSKRQLLREWTPARRDPTSQREYERHFWNDFGIDLQFCWKKKHTEF